MSVGVERPKCQGIRLGPNSRKWHSSAGHIDWVPWVPSMKVYIKTLGTVTNCEELEKIILWFI
jgi:hypothetical protein